MDHRPESAVPDGVDFIYVGPDKSGSTWLDERLRSNPQVQLPRTKETFFFDRYFDRGFKWYLQNYDGPKAGRIRGELSHDYLFDQMALERIANAQPDVKVIVGLREPVERAYSAYRYMKFQGRLARDVDFTDALEWVDELLAHGMYGELVSTVLAHFPIEQVYFAIFDDLKADAQSYYDDLCDYLAIDRQTVSDLDLLPSLSAREARFWMLNRLLRRGAWMLRDLGFQGIVGRVKRSMVLSWLSKPTGQPAADEISRARVRYSQMIESDLRTLIRVADLDLAARWGYITGKT